MSYIYLPRMTYVMKANPLLTTMVVSHKHTGCQYFLYYSITDRIQIMAVDQAFLLMTLL